MILHTASEGISFAKKLETDSSKFYEELGRKFSGSADTFLAYAKENKKNIVQTEQAYYGVITDAIEGGYAFNIDTDRYVLKTVLPHDADNAGVLKQATEIERTIIKFYTDAAEQSKSLMADIPRTFMTIAKKRESRLVKINSLFS